MMRRSVQVDANQRVPNPGDLRANILADCRYSITNLLLANLGFVKIMAYGVVRQRLHAV